MKTIANTITNFDEALNLAKEKGIKIQDEGDINREIGFGAGVKLPDGYEGVLINVLNTSYEKSICVESLTKDKKMIKARIYEFENGEFKMCMESPYTLEPNGRNTELRKNIWELNKDGTMNEIWRQTQK